MPPEYVARPVRTRGLPHRDRAWRPSAGASCRSRCGSCTCSTAPAATCPNGTRRSSGASSSRSPVAELRAAPRERAVRVRRRGRRRRGRRARARRAAVSGAVVVVADRAARARTARCGCAIDVENRTRRERRGDRDAALRHALVAAHTMLAIDRGRFLSMTDPPEWARPEVAVLRATRAPGPCSPGPSSWCCRRRSSSATTRRSRRRARAISTTRPRSTRSSRCAR